MSSREFTLQSGLVLPILKASASLPAEPSLEEIYTYVTANALITPCEDDLVQIDFNGRTRLVCAVDACISLLVGQGYLIKRGSGFSISALGAQRIGSEWDHYSHQAFIKRVDVDNKNKLIYLGIPAYLLYSGHKMLSVSGFSGREKESFKLLNDFLDYVDLNYPTVEEMSDFLTKNYEFGHNDECIEAIRVLRAVGLVKMIGKNLSTTKLGQWYVNSYDRLALFKILANRYIGFDEMLKILALHQEMDIDMFKDVLQHTDRLDWIPTNQFNERMNWLENLRIAVVSGNRVSLGKEAKKFAEYVGYLPR